VLGPEHPDTLDSMHNLAITYAAEQKYAEAETLHGQALESRRRVLGPRHARTTDTMESWGETRIRAGKYAEAEPLLRECRTALSRAS
jgi:eukaryotic-like serine/threonine-protein kinase